MNKPRFETGKPKKRKKSGILPLPRASKRPTLGTGRGRGQLTGHPATIQEVSSENFEIFTAQK